MTTTGRYIRLWCTLVTMLLGIQCVEAFRVVRGDFEYDCDYMLREFTATLTRYHGSAANVTIPDTIIYESFVYPVTAIGNEFYSPFADNATVRSIKLPAHALSVGPEAFNGCSALEDVALNRKLQYIGPRAFAHCHQLNRVETFDNLLEVDDQAFSDCPSLYELTLGHRLSTLGNGVFDDTNLQSLILFNSQPATCRGSLSRSATFYEECMLFVPIGSSGVYAITGDEWPRFANIIEQAVPGDFNRDGQVDISDVNLLINVILNPGGQHSPSYDLNHDGAIDISDVNTLINIILSK